MINTNNTDDTEQIGWKIVHKKKNQSVNRPTKLNNNKNQETQQTEEEGPTNRPEPECTNKAPQNEDDWTMEYDTSSTKSPSVSNEDMQQSENEEDKDEEMNENNVEH